MKKAMKKSTCGLLIVFTAGLFAMPAQAQIFKKIKNKLEKKANEVVEDEVDGIIGNRKGEHKAIIRRGGVNNKPISYDFEVGDSLIYSSDFDALSLGAMPREWKTSSSGSIIQPEGMSGQWLQLQTGATYKLKDNQPLPDEFTIEFDIIAAAEKIDDLSPVFFGFTKDNAVRGWTSHSDLCSLELQYYNNNRLVLNSNVKDVYQSVNYDLRPYANIPMHVAIHVQGTYIKVYLENTKIADTELLSSASAPHFYFSAPFSADYNASVLIGNFTITGVKGN